MFRGSKIKASTRKRLLILLAVAVLFPVFILITAQSTSLTGLDKLTKAAVKENLRQNLLDFERRTAEKFEAIAAKSLIPAVKIKLSDEKEFEKYFSSVKNSQPEIEQIFAFAYQEDESNNFGYVFSDSFRKYNQSDLKTDEKLRKILQNFDDSQKAQNFLGASRIYLFQFSTNSYETFIFYPLFDANYQKQIGFAGIKIYQNYVRDELFSLTVTEVIKSRQEIIPKSSDLFVSINDAEGKDFFSTFPNHQKYVVETNFNAPFSNWNAKIGYKTTNFETLVGLGYKQRIGAIFFFLFFLIIGIALTIRAAIRELRLAQTKSAFVSNVSHELKTPLSLISLFAELLEIGQVKSEEKKQEYYRIIREETRRLNKLIENILDFSKIEAGGKTYNFTECDIGEVVENVISDYQYQIKNSGFELEINLEKNLPPVLVDRDAIAQAVLNLLDNAIKYSAETKKIFVAVKTHKFNVLIEIADCGLGIPRKEQKKIFEKFYRVGNDLIHNIKGSGLGLSLVKHIVEAHQGKISVKSEVGKGSCFTISIPFIKSKVQKDEVYQFVENTNH
jgi:signal transduction histidine kinase